MRLLFALFTILSSILLMTTAAIANLNPVLVCAPTTEPTIEMILSTSDAPPSRVAEIRQDGLSVYSYVLPIQPLMTSVAGSVTATYSTNDFVLTIAAGSLDQREPSGNGILAFRRDEQAPVSFEVVCGPPAPLISLPADAVETAAPSQPEN